MTEPTTPAAPASSEVGAPAPDGSAPGRAPAADGDAVPGRASVAGRAAKARTTRGLWAARAALLGPGVVYLAVFLLVPLALVLSYAFFRRGRFGGVVHEVTFENFSRLADEIYVQVLTDSLVIATVTTALALALGYPAAYAIAKLPRRWRTVALVLVVLPFWTNFLVRTYAWIVLLSTQGVVNKALTGIGIIDKPLEMLYSTPAVVAGLLYAYLPLMILPLYSAIERLDDSLAEASVDLGASKASTFWHVTLPLTLPGALTGCIFVFVPSLGNFIVPELLGGGRTVMVGNLIRDQFLKARDWPFGAALALTLLAFLVVLLLAQSWASRRRAT
ncbi:ABC transporter permease [Cryptosporangium aurantiacum]|uniref:Spermidine/putrescine transport system permease protein n=1 Tax=Cryptosporangium aurantiacum TaxID=134849 RepID=A0A1M7H2G1_9ACTN|nr:ABC transporter permease [Cryptosporangium aurantiacum]SHM22526.1 spermidine/putrescine transport system permease protein [Cryptosporangium aurantiacum]